MKRAVYLLVIGAMLAGLVIGCAPPAKPTPTPVPPAATPTPVPKASPTPAKPTDILAEAAEKCQGVHLNAIMVMHPTSDVIQKMLPQFTEKTGIDVSIEIANYDDTHEKELLDLAGGTAAYDVMLMDNPWLPEFVETGNVLPLDDYLAKEDPEWVNDFIPKVFRLYGHYKGKHYSLPFLVGTQILFYRKDLFEQYADAYKAKTGRELKPPETWEEFLEIAKFFTKEYNPDSPIDYGVAVAAAKGNAAICEFQPMLWGVGGREFDENWNVTINNEKGVYAMELFAEMAKYAPPGSGSNYYVEENNDFIKGKAAMEVQWDPFATVNIDPKESLVYDKMGYAMIPGGAPVLGGWALIINKNTKHPDCAYAFLHWATGKEIAKDVTLQGGLPGRISVFTDPELVEKYPWFPVALEAYKASQQRTSPYDGGPTIIPEAQYELIVGTYANAAFTGQMTPKEAVDAAAKELEKMMIDFGYLKK